MFISLKQSRKKNTFSRSLKNSDVIRRERMQDCRKSSGFGVKCLDSISGSATFPGDTSGKEFTC